MSHVTVASRLRAREVSSLLLLTSIASGAAVYTPDVPPRDAQAVRFAVAQKLSSSWCYGYLTVIGDSLRYEAVQPAECTTNSFQARRFELHARQWTVLGIPQAGVELRLNGSKLIFEWLADESEVQTGSSWRASPPRANEPGPMLTAISALPAPPGFAAAATGGSAPEATPASAGADKGDPMLTGAPADPGASAMPRPANPGANAMPRPVGPVRFHAGIGFIAPEGWSVTENGGAAVMQPPAGQNYEAPCVALLLPPRPAQSDVVAQAYAIANELFAAQFGRLTGDLGGDIRKSLYVGVSGKGWEYVELFGVLGDENHRIDGRILLAHMGSQVVPMAAVSRGGPCLGNRYYRDNDNWALLFHSLQLPGYTEDSPALKQLLLGEWEEVGSTTYTSKRFAANGHFGRLDAHATYTESSRPGMVVQDTRFWDGDGTYEVHGDRLTFRPRSGSAAGKSQTELFRIVRRPNANKPGGYEFLLLEVSHADEPVVGMSPSGNYVFGMVKQKDESAKQ